MNWLEAHGLTLALLVSLGFHWVRMEIKLAIVVRDMEWVRAGLTSVGIRVPNIDKPSKRQT